MPTITNLPQLKINYLTQAQYDAAVANDEIDEDQLYFTPDGFLDKFYPVGTIYETLDSTFDPNTAWGGVWKRIEDKFLLAAGSTYHVGDADGGSADAIVPYHRHSIAAKDTDEESAHTHLVSGDTGNESSHTHGTGSSTYVNFVRHKSSVYNMSVGYKADSGHVADAPAESGFSHGEKTGAGTSHKHTVSITSGAGTSHKHTLASHNTNYVGTDGNTTGANMPPYTIVNIWKRTA